jgi:hypothetical protein
VRTTAGEVGGAAADMASGRASETDETAQGARGGARWSRRAGEEGYLGSGQLSLCCGSNRRLLGAGGRRVGDGVAGGRKREAR